MLMTEQIMYGLTPLEFIKLALEEDTGNGDHTSMSTIDKNKTGTARVRVKEGGIVAGLEIARLILNCVDTSLVTDMRSADGAVVAAGDDLMMITGNVRSLLRAERLLLNCLQRMSGIATLTRQFTEAVKGTQTKILDTRKTTPNFRYFEKLAVRLGGGYNHRIGLYDMILIKDNHVDAAGGIGNALMKAGEYLKNSGMNLQIEIETRNLEEVEEVLKTGIADRIMLDNFEIPVLKEAVKLIGKRFETEASGGIVLGNARDYALTGVDYLSVGALTHSYKSMDISMKIKN